MIKPNDNNNKEDLKSIETPLGSVKINSSLTEESMIDWVKDRLSKDDEKDDE